MALTAPTDFVWLVDDDMIPGNKYLAQLMHAAGTDLLGSSLLGSIGRVLPRPGRDMSLVSYRKVKEPTVGFIFAFEATCCFVVLELLGVGSGGGGD